VSMLTPRERLVLAADEARTAMRPAADSARLRVGTATDQALATLTTTVLPALIEAREKLAPFAEQAVEQGRVRGRQAAIRWHMMEEPPPPPPEKSHWFRNLLVALGLGAAGTVAYKILSDRSSNQGWTSSSESAAPSSAGFSGESGGDSVPWGDTPGEQMPGMDPTAVDPVVAEPAGSDPLESEVPAATAGPIDGSDTAPTAPLASAETTESSVPTTPDQPLEQRDIT
jgi:hypothetical protein